MRLLFRMLESDSAGNAEHSAHRAATKASRIPNESNRRNEEASEMPWSPLDARNVQREL